MGLDHHGGVVVILGIGLEHLGLGLGCRRPGHTIGAVNVLGDQVNPVTQLGFQGIEELEVCFIFTGVNNRIGKF